MSPAFSSSTAELFTGSPLDFVPNTEIVGFSMTVLGETFDLGHVDTTAFTLIDSAAVPPIIVVGARWAGGQWFPEDFLLSRWGERDSDGWRRGTRLFFAGLFGRGSSRTSVANKVQPEPATLLLVGLCFAALGLTRRKHPSRVMHP